MARFAAALLLMITFCTGTLRAQHYVGVRGGWGGGSARILPAEETGIEWGLKSGGISYKFFTSTKYVGGIQADLEYLERGFNYKLGRNSDTSYHRTVNSVSLPFMWQPHVYVFQRQARVFINLGVTFSYNMNSKYYVREEGVGIIESGNYPMLIVRDNRFGYGLVGGLGLSVFINRFEVALEGRYYYGYSDIRKNRTVYRIDPEDMRPWDINPLRSPLDNINISVAAYYRLSNEEIRSAVSKGTARRLMKSEQQKIIKNATK